MVEGCTFYGGNGKNFEVATANLFATWVERFHHIALIFFCESSKKCKEEEIIVGIFVCIKSNKYEDSFTCSDDYHHQSICTVYTKKKKDKLVHHLK